LHYPESQGKAETAAEIVRKNADGEGDNGRILARVAIPARKRNRKFRQNLAGPAAWKGKRSVRKLEDPPTRPKKSKRKPKSAKGYMSRIKI
jgi:hypothetical protein